MFHVKRWVRFGSECSTWNIFQVHLKQGGNWLTNEQLYLTMIGPLMGLILNLGLFAILFNHMTKIEDRITARIDVLTSKVVDMDNRISRIEERLRIQ
jgi:hypothetical protein